VRVLLLINATLNQETARQIAADRSPRKDYLELQRALGADVVDLGALQRHLWTRLARRLCGASLAQALLAWVRARHYDVVFADRETTGLALAALFKLGRKRPRLVMIGHLLSPPKKQLLWRALRLHATSDCVIVHSSLQQRIAERALGLRAEPACGPRHLAALRARHLAASKGVTRARAGLRPRDLARGKTPARPSALARARVALVPYQTDERFWAPRDVPLKNQICSAGLEYRDYRTLAEAVAGLDVDVVVAAASHWSKHESPLESRGALHAPSALPPNVRVAAFDYAALRQLYAESLFVVVPLHDVENQAGITTILEAMAMGKAVVVSHTRGQTDVVRDRRRHSRHDPRRLTQPDWARSLGATEETVQGHTGIYVQPGDPAELRRAISFLLDHPDQARLMGRSGRRLIEETMGLDHFTARLATIITGAQPAGYDRRQAIGGRR
jgi:glycosyltransferase involved in cell wall biosynthesis